MNAKLGRFLGLIIVTGFALTVAITVTAGGWGRAAPDGNGQSAKVIPETPVSVMQARLESIEITDSYSGMIRPWERFALGFEVAGRVIELGTANSGDGSVGRPLDEGDEVSAGQVLARLDDRVLLARLEESRARLQEANAQLEEAQADMRRSQVLKDSESGNRAITEARYQEDVTQLAVANAQLALATAQLQAANKQFQDTKLVSPVAGVISRRMVNAGESVTAHQTILEIIQVDAVLLVVGVPEAYVGEICAGQRVHVELLARDRFRRKRPSTTGRIHQVAEAADRTTGLFEVEIAVANPQRKWKPGLIALAHIVLTEVEGFRLPMAGAVFRKNKTFLFSAAADGEPLTAAGQQGTAHRFELDDWIEQGAEMILAELPPRHRAVVVRGQHQLLDGQRVSVVGIDDKQAADESLPARTPTTVVGSRP